MLRHSVFFRHFFDIFFRHFFLGIEQNTHGIVLCLSFIIYHFGIFDFISVEQPSKRPIIRPLSLYFDCTHDINSFNWWLKMVSRAHQKYWHSSYCLGALLSSAFFPRKHTARNDKIMKFDQANRKNGEREFECCIEIPE